jgi:negative regulator of flagellin synthesis FlgM
MKIGSFENKPIAATPTPPAVAERKASTAATTAATAPATEASAQVDLSAAASALSSAGTSNDGSFDAGKVERIAQAIRDGNFKVNPEAIADKLIDNAKELLTRKPS